jgi:hypothetical protein
MNTSALMVMMMMMIFLSTSQCFKCFKFFMSLRQIKCFFQNSLGLRTGQTAEKSMRNQSNNKTISSKPNVILGPDSHASSWTLDNVQRKLDLWLDWRKNLEKLPLMFLIIKISESTRREVIPPEAFPCIEHECSSVAGACPHVGM